MTETHPLTPARARRGLRDYAGLMLRGVAMGASDIVPGVSGGTMALILGIYEELIDSIREIGRRRFLLALFSADLGTAFRVLNWPFLVAVAAGILTAFLTLAHGLEWLLIHQPVLLWSFFFGLVLASVFTVAGRIPRWTPPLALALGLGAVGAFVIVGLVPATTPNSYAFLFVSGALAICAMILPGISGAFILVLLGKYQYVLGALTSGDIASLFFVAAGAGIGIITFAQIVGYFFKRFHDLTLALLTGLMLGSLRKIWPWKVDLAWLTAPDGSFALDSAGERIVTLQRNVLPELTVNGAFNVEIVLALGLALAGLGVVLLLERFATTREAA